VTATARAPSRAAAPARPAAPAGRQHAPTPEVSAQAPVEAKRQPPAAAKKQAPAQPVGAANAAPDELARLEDEFLAMPAAAPASGPAEPEVIEFERTMARRRKLTIGVVGAVAGIALVFGLGSLAWKQLRGASHDPAAVEKVDRLLGAVRTGDPARALEAAALGEEALAIEPAFVRARADRGLALLVAAAARKDLADRVAARRTPIERALRKAEDGGDNAAAEELRGQLAALKAEYDPLLAAYGKLKADADAAIEGAYQGAGQDDPGAVRAMGMLRASSGDEKNAPVLAKNYRKLAGETDGWADLIEGQLFTSGRASPEKRAQAVEKLTSALQRDASFGIAYLLLGRARLDLQDFAGARRDLAQALVAAPGNELAKRWLADVDSALSAAAQPKAPPAAPAPPAPGLAQPPTGPAAG
jgi:tetratricopeptide (TPR) repeat protein